MPEVQNTSSYVVDRSGPKENDMVPALKICTNLIKPLHESVHMFVPLHKNFKWSFHDGENAFYGRVELTEFVSPKVLLENLRT